MPVKQVEDGAVLCPNQVHVIPPSAGMTISGITLSLRPRETAGTTIDGFLRSLAVNHTSRAFAVILSGTGSDGALGVQAVAEAGGVVFAQDPASAKFDGMPRSAIATGCVDFILPPAEIAKEVIRLVREPLVTQEQAGDLSRPPLGSPKHLAAVYDLVRAATGIDFSHYRQTTVRRRLLRRLAFLRLGSLGDYLEHIRENPDEVHALTQDILIRVTHFFRDAEAFEALSRRVFPALIRRTPLDRAIRIWVPGCSTGEEAYSIGVAFLEAAEQMRSRVSLQIFATDVNEAAIEKARRGAYIENIAADVSPQRLARYFVRVGRGYDISRKLRDLCIFSRHDLLNDPPFSRMDLVSCRNVLIYLDSMQEQVFSKFHFALNPDSFLLLGKSETAPPKWFAPLDKSAKVYVRHSSAGSPAPALRKGTPHPPREVVATEPRPPRRVDPRFQADRIIVQRYGPPRVVVNANLEVIADSSESGVLESIQSEAEAVKEAIRSAGRTGQSTRIEQFRIRDGATPREVSLEITPLEPDRLHFLIVVEDQAGVDPDLGTAPARGSSRSQEAAERRLGKELAETRAHLESVIVEQEASSEEIIASNEELLSLNEELESSKEELEATNEELTTINQELQVRNTELENAREFAQATIDTVRGALVVLGADLRVLKANQSFYRAFGLSEGEAEHRFIYELNGGRWSIPRLRQLLEEILLANHTMKDFGMDYDSAAFGRRLLVLNASRFEREERILLAIEDVTESRRAEEELRHSQKMEAIGYLAAGVAHDFNNLLTAVIGNASMVANDLPEGDPHKRLIENVIGGAQKAADLTRQLLAYAGKGRFLLERVNLSEAVVQTSRLLHPSIPANVQLRLELEKDLPLLLADAGQIQQVAMNLLVNAVEAIGEGAGTITVRTGLQTVTGEPLPDLLGRKDAAPGEYIFLDVQDNGCGMSEETIRKIFDPFFTTKFTGRGLGLAALLGIVRQHHGAIQVQSVPGRGSTFRVLLPAREMTEPPKAEALAPADLRGSATVLVVDDEEMIRNYTRSALESYGYTVLLAEHGEKALQVFEKKSGEIGLVLLDVAMPGMDGLQTLERIREIRAAVPVLICSGFGDVDIEARFKGKGIAGFLPKPFTLKQLARKVKESMPAAGSPA